MYWVSFFFWLTCAVLCRKHIKDVRAVCEFSHFQAQGYLKVMQANTMCNQATMGSLHDTFAWYKIRHAGWQKNATASKTKRFPLAKPSSRADFIPCDSFMQRPHYKWTLSIQPNVNGHGNQCPISYGMKDLFQRIADLIVHITTI